MRANRTLEIGTGLFVLLGFAALLFLTVQLPANGLKLGAPKAGYHVTAEFDNIGDLKVGAPVTMAGVRVGEVASIRFDSKDYKAAVACASTPNTTRFPRTASPASRHRGCSAASTSASAPEGSTATSRTAAALTRLSPPSCSRV